MPPCLLLDPAEILHVLASTCICYAAFADGAQPYILPLGYALTDRGCILLHLRPNGTAGRMLQRNPHVCLAFSLLTDAWVDSVLIRGTAAPVDPVADGSIPVCVQVQDASGRRFPLHLPD